MGDPGTGRAAVLLDMIHGAEDLEKPFLKKEEYVKIGDDEVL